MKVILVQCLAFWCSESAEDTAVVPGVRICIKFCLKYLEMRL